MTRSTITTGPFPTVRSRMPVTVPVLHVTALLPLAGSR